MSEGWIKLHRSILDNKFWTEKPFTKGQAFVDLILRANFKDGEFYKNNRLIKVQRGQTARSEISLSKDWGWSRQKVRGFLAALEQNGKIEQLKTQLTTYVTICNYDKYQGCPDVDDTTEKTTDLTTGRQPKDNQPYTNKNVKNNKNEKNVKKTNTSATPPSSAQDDLFAQFWNAYPVKKDKGRCRKIWAKIKPDQFVTSDIISAIENQKGERMVLEDRDEFVPCWKNPSTWLNGQCWEDEISEKAMEIQKDNDRIDKFLKGEKIDNVIHRDFRW